MSKIFERSLSYETIFDDFNLDLSPSVYGYEVCQKNKPLIEINKPLYIIHFIVSGKGTVYKEDGASIELGSSSCFITRPDKTLRYRQNQSDPWRYFWIEFGGIGAKKIIDSIDFRDDYLSLDESTMKEIKYFFKGMFNEDVRSSSQSAEALRITGLVYSILSVLSNSHSIKKMDMELSKKEAQIREVIEYINSNYQRSDISIKSIADHFFFNPSYLSRTFKEFTGTSPSSYIIELRMKKAQELLKTGRYSISQIAYTLGFKNQFYFSREFSRCFDISPSKYKSSYSGD